MSASVAAAQEAALVTSPGFMVSHTAATPLESSDQPPVMSARFHVNFVENTRSRPFGSGKDNLGSLHYDIENMRQVWVHGKGQTDNWCQCAGVSTDEACHIIAAPSKDEEGGGAAFIAFKSLGKCCKLGDYAHGFGPLRPDWLRVSHAKKQAPERVGNRTCTAWSGGPPGDWFTMISDDWSFDENGKPCTYEDHFKWWARTVFGMRHILTFDEGSYSEQLEFDDIFEIPANCHQNCPNKAGGWCAAR